VPVKFRHRGPAGAAALALLIAAVSTGPALAGPSSPSISTRFEVGAAETDVTPPALATLLGQSLDRAEFTPVCGTSEAQIAQLWPGRRLFAFEKPYVDLFGAGEYVPGDPYCDADATHRYEAPYIAGGSGANHWPLTSADTDPRFNTQATRPASPYLNDDPVSAQAVVFSEGGRRAAMVTVNSIGLFDSTMDSIRAAVGAADPALAPQDIFVSSTHDESAPDPIGLWGPDLSGEPAPINQLNGNLPAGASSGVDEYYMEFLVQRVAAAILQADRSVRPAALKLAVAKMPPNTQSCWSSYPFIDTGLVPVMQAVATSGAGPGHVIFTMANVGTHDETLAFSGNPAYTSMLSGDWTGRLSALLEADYPGSVGMEMAGLVGSVETPALYPPGTQVVDVPGKFHDVPGKPVDGCSSVYPEPASRAAPVTDALAFVDAFANSVSNSVTAALTSGQATTEVPNRLSGESQPVCVQLENNYFAAAFAAGLFPDRPAYADPACTVGVAQSGTVAVGGVGRPATPKLAPPAFLRSEVGVLTVGPAQIAYSPGEVFPVTEIGGPFDAAQSPFPTDCYLPPSNYTCGSPLPATDDVAAEMTEPYRFMAGLGEDMIGYLFPPGNFVGSQGEVLEPPWSTYEETSGTGHDRFGYGHADDSESVGPYAGLAVTQALSGLLSREGSGTTVMPGMFLDSAGRLCDSPFPSSGSWVTGCSGFTGAVGVEVVRSGGEVQRILVGTAPGDANGWATYLATQDSGTPGTVYPYSTATRGVIAGGHAIILDVVAGAEQLG
jgi:hypothetical protein